MSATVALTISAMGYRGEGVASRDGETVFVPGTLPGEVVTATLAGKRGTLVSLETPSPDRIAPFCPHFGACGGCQTQHWAAPAYRAWKEGLVREALARAGIAAEVNPLIDARGEGRRRATLHATREHAGFMALRSHTIHPLDHCPILVPALANAPEIARAVAAYLGPCDVAFTATRTGLDVAVHSPAKSKSRLKVRPADMRGLAALAERFGLCRIAVAGEVVVRLRAAEVAMGDAIVSLPPASFLQATERAETILAEQVVAGAAGARSIADLFCGLGPFALRLATHAPVHAADSDGPATAALGEAARHTRGLKPIDAERRDLFADPLSRFELDRFDTVVLDPPRAGAAAQIAELVGARRLDRVVSVSCDPASFARDAAALVAGGFTMGPVTPVDQFAHSSHVEVVATFTRH